MKIELSHIITIVVVLVGYLTAILVAWGRMIAEVKNIKEQQKNAVDRSDLLAAVAEMKAEMYKALGDRRKTSRRSDDA